MTIPIIGYSPAPGCNCHSVCIPRRRRLDNLSRHVEVRGLVYSLRATLVKHRIVRHGGWYA